MADHDPMCPQYDQTEHSIVMFDTPCRCEEYARVRADERAKVYRPDAHQMMLERDAARAARDAARTEARVAKSEIRVLAAFLAEARAEVAALQVLAQDANEAFASGRREVLADVRAKVSSGWVPELDHEARIAVLALLDGADQ